VNEDGADVTTPVRRMRDANTLRALAHPVRIQLLEELALVGPMTATELAARVGESAANCSWHLRQLARYGYVEEAGGGAGRRRPWKAVLRRNQWEQSPDDAELAAAGDTLAEVVLSREVAALEQWRSAVHQDLPQWREAPFVSQSMGWLTVDELAEVNEQITAILVRYLDRLNDRALRPAGARPIRFMAWGIPAEGYAAAGEEEQSEQTAS
jgi:DNA-binding transcriptional ArsR family regulator